MVTSHVKLSRPNSTRRRALSTSTVQPLNLEDNSLDNNLMLLASPSVTGTLEKQRSPKIPISFTENKSLKRGQSVDRFSSSHIFENWSSADFIKEIGGKNNSPSTHIEPTLVKLYSSKSEESKIETTSPSYTKGVDDNVVTGTTLQRRRYSFHKIPPEKLNSKSFLSSMLQIKASSTNPFTLEYSKFVIFSLI
jgi:hypothetical protein